MSHAEQSRSTTGNAQTDTQIPGPEAKQPPPSLISRVFRRRGLPSLLLFALAAALYLPWSDGGFLYDDRVLILKPQRPESLQAVGRKFVEQLVNRDPDWPGLPYYRPIPRITYTIQKYLHGDNPQPYHVFNVALIGAIAIAAYSLLRRPVFGIPPGLAWLGAAVFALHPIASCCAYPISARETMMPALFVITSLVAYLRGRRTGIAAALLLFVAGLMSKEQAVVTPALFFLADWLRLTPDPPGRNGWRWMLRYAPVVGIMAGYAFLRMHLFGESDQHQLAVFLSPMGPVYSVLFTLQTILTPYFDLVYEPSLQVWWTPWRQAVVFAVMTAGAVAAYRAGPAIRLPLYFWAGWFLLALLPMANIFLQEANFAERYGFLSLLGLVGAACQIISTGWGRSLLRRGALIAGAGLAVACAVVSYHRGIFYQDEFTFLSQWVHTSLQSAESHFTLGQQFLRQDRLDEAAVHFRLSLEIEPTAKAHNQLATVFALQGRLAEAAEHFQKSIGLVPDYAESYNHLGIVHSMQGDFPRAIDSFHRAIDIDPRYAEAYYNLGNALDAANRLDEAAGAYREAIRLYPGYAGAHNNLGLVLGRQGKFSEAASHFEQALALEPTLQEAAINLEHVREAARQKR